MVLYLPNFSLVFLIHVFLYAGVYCICNNSVLKFSPGRTDFTLALKIRSLVFVDIDAEFHKACLALPILLFTSVSAPPSVKWQHYFQADLKRRNMYRQD